MATKKKEEKPAEINDPAAEPVTEPVSGSDTNPAEKPETVQDPVKEPANDRPPATDAPAEDPVIVEINDFTDDELEQRDINQHEINTGKTDQVVMFDGSVKSLDAVQEFWKNLEKEQNGALEANLETAKATFHESRKPAETDETAA